MAVHLTEEEQIEALKRWWKKNGLATVAALVLSVGGFWGWQLFQSHQERQAEAASLAYQSFMETVERFEEGEGEAVSEEAVRAQAEALIDDHGRSMYADFATLYLARLAVEQEAFDEAKSLMRQVVSDGANETVRDLARLRLGRIMAGTGQTEEALQLLSSRPSGAYASAYAEARGDALKALGRMSEAREAYQSALASMNDPRSIRASLLQLKIDNTLVAADTAEPTPGMDYEIRPNPHQAPAAGGA